MTTLVIESDGNAIASWRDDSLCGSPGCQGIATAALRLASTQGESVHAVVVSSNDPSELPVGRALTLSLEPHDTLLVSGAPDTPFAGIPLCGTEAQALTVSEQNAEGINCGA